MSVEGTTLIWRVVVETSPSASRPVMRIVFRPGVSNETVWTEVSVQPPKLPVPRSHWKRPPEFGPEAKNELPALSETATAVGRVGISLLSHGEAESPVATTFGATPRLT